ncbi:uncharacterized protein [Miscanthus floridulus]|uniref:uncharacterized protein isoform X1 n=1 Tax=Miscanthus floridulus TaxID=154761 RepID=UPI0034586583
MQSSLIFKLAALCSLQVQYPVAYQHVYASFSDQKAYSVQSLNHLLHCWERPMIQLSNGSSMASLLYLIGGLYQPILPFFAVVDMVGWEVARSMGGIGWVMVSSTRPLLPPSPRSEHGARAQARPYVHGQPLLRTLSTNSRPNC